MIRPAAAIPAYQAARTVAEVVRETRAVLPNVLVVDDGSWDSTGEEALRAGAEVVVHSRNLGKGAALATAFRVLFGRGFDAVVTLDADGQHIPEEIPRLLACAIETGADLVLGTRDAQFAEMSPVRRWSNRLSSGAISLFAGLSIPDIQTGFRLYTKRLIEVTGLPGSGFEAESAVVVRAARRGLRIVATPVRLGRPDGRATSHYRPFLDSFRIARAVLGERLRRAAPAASRREPGVGRGTPEGLE